MMEPDPRWQRLAQERAARARHKHANPEGFDTTVECWGYEDIEAGVRCPNLPEFHIEQLDGECHFACRRCAIILLTKLEPIPLQGSGGNN
jgi:hypothetical protein